MKTFFNIKTTGILLVLLSIAMGVATFVETAQSTEVARNMVYGAVWFEMLLALLTINITGSLFLYKSFLWNKITVPIFHLAMVMILFGAFFTRYLGFEGSIHIREGQTTAHIQIDQSKRTMPFTLELTDFELERYPGSNSPSSYSSHVILRDKEKDVEIPYHIYMNHILKYDGWRFFQTSYDQDEQGTILTASHDPLGTTITYIGYFLIVVGMFLSLVMPGTYFRRLIKSFDGKTIALIALLSTPFISQANLQNNSVGKEEARTFGELIVQDPQGRMKVLNTYSNEFMRKIHGSEKLNDLTADQVVLSMLVYPDYWGQQPVLELDRKDVKQMLGVRKDYISYHDLFDEKGQYVLTSHIHRIIRKPANERNKTDKNLLELDDKANILSSFLQGNNLRILPGAKSENNQWHDHSTAWMYCSNREDSLFARNILPLYLESLRNNNPEEAAQYIDAIELFQKKFGSEVYPEESKVKAELFYNRSHIFKNLKMTYGIFGFIMLILFFVLISKGKELNKTAQLLFQIFVILLFLIHTFGIGLRWHVGGFVPLSNAYETMVFISWFCILTGIALSKKFPSGMALSLIMGFTFLFVAGLNNSNPAIGNLVPVLKSPWLSIHVAVITSSYALFGMVTLISSISMIFYLFLNKKNSERLLTKTDQFARVNQILLIIGLYLLTAGTIFGAVWANESWGRYWGWDPKETWALICILVYAFVTHMRLIPVFKKEIWQTILSFWAFSSILMTFFGVNYFLVGMHSYAGTGDAVIPRWLGYVIGGLIVFTYLSIQQYRKNVKMS